MNLIVLEHVQFVPFQTIAICVYTFVIICNHLYIYVYVISIQYIFTNNLKLMMKSEFLAFMFLSWMLVSVISFCTSGGRVSLCAETWQQNEILLCIKLPSSSEFSKILWAARFEFHLKCMCSMIFHLIRGLLIPASQRPKYRSTAKLTCNSKSWAQRHSETKLGALCILVHSH